jgi:hypothetical protein
MCRLATYKLLKDHFELENVIIAALAQDAEVVSAMTFVVPMIDNEING